MPLSSHPVQKKKKTKECQIIIQISLARDYVFLGHNAKTKQNRAKLCKTERRSSSTLFSSYSSFSILNHNHRNCRAIVNAKKSRIAPSRCKFDARNAVNRWPVVYVQTTTSIVFNKRQNSAESNESRRGRSLGKRVTRRERESRRAKRFSSARVVDPLTPETLSNNFTSRFRFPSNSFLFQSNFYFEFNEGFIY